jgi:DNA polymerase-3 subunit delta'
VSTAPSNQLFGHEQTVDLLKDAILGSRSMPTWIFGGPFGVGKFTAAHLLAGLLLDPETRPEDVRAFRPRQDTPSGRLHAAGTHPDLHVVCKEQALESPDQQVRDRKQRSIPVAVLRQQIIGGAIEGHTFDAPAYMKPSRGTGKVFIIDEAELIESRGQNLLLKTLEEPPPRTWFILVSTRPDRLLPTIRSRCQPAAFSPLAPEAMALWRAHAELDTDPDELDWAIDFAEGAPGLALAMIHEGLFEWHRTFAPMIRELGDGGYPTSMADAMEECIEASAVAAEKADPQTSKQAAGRKAMGLMVTLLSSLMRSNLHEVVVAGGPDSERWARAIEILAGTEQQIEANVNRKLALSGLVPALADQLAPGRAAS